MVEVTDLGYRYRSGAGIANISFTARGVAGIAGRNGAGKTTLFSCLVGLLDRQSGEVAVDGRRVDPKKEPWGYAPSSEYFLPRLTGRQNLEYQSWLKTGHGDAWKAWRSWLDDLDLTPVLDKPFREYSTGMRKKVQLVNSLVGDPAVLVWDEPHNGVDLVSNAVIGRLMVSLGAEGRTLLLSSHVAEVLVTVCSSLHILKNGSLSASLVPPFPEDLIPLL